MDANLTKLADRLGIATEFSDGGLKSKKYDVDEKVIKFLASAMGYPASNDEEINHSLDKLDNLRWQQALEYIYVRTQNDVFIDVVSADLSGIEIEAKSGDGAVRRLDYEYMKDTARHDNLYKESLRITTPLEIGYYDIKVTLGGKKYDSVLAIAPERCYDNLPQDKKIWGYAVQLYSVKSKRNWGVGDFSDLAELVKLCAASGADIIGLNPLNVLCHDFPENASPYSSISREFLNPIYIDVEKVPEFTAADKKPIEKLLQELRDSELVAYEKVYPLKVKMLEQCFARLQKGEDKKRQKAYKDYCSAKGKSLENLALFQAIYEAEKDKVWGGWQAWPQKYSSPKASGVKEFLAEHKDRVEFFKFMQFEAERQFALVKEVIDSSNMKIGLYRDLAVGVGKDSAEYWGNHDLFIPSAGAGAPPDAFFPAGQRWELGAFLPHKLKEEKYLPFINILRANMQNAGALRMDHVMSLMRLYIIPDTMDGGSYVYYNFADMLNIVAIESWLNRCMIVGESIGNVPEGFLEALSSKNIYALSILWAERLNYGWGDFRQPESYPSNAFVSVGTHDIAPLKMWWFGYDIELNYEVGLLSDLNEKAEMYHKRETDRKFLLAALDAAGVWPQDKLRSGDYIYGEQYPEGIEEAVMKFMSKSNPPVFLAQLEDIFGVDKLQNLPGTDRDKYPNWRRKLPLDLEDMKGDDRYTRCVAAISAVR